MLLGQYGQSLDVDPFDLPCVNLLLYDDVLYVLEFFLYRVL